MHTFRFLSSVPFVLCSLRAPDAGAPAGGGTADPAPPVTPTAPEPEGNTVEEKLESARGHIRSLFERVGQLTSQLGSTSGERDRLQTQFEVAATAMTDEKKAHDKTKGELSHARIEITARTTERDASNRNVERLEKLCSLQGVDSKAVVQVPAEPGHGKTDDKSPAGIWNQYESLRKQERTNDVKQGTARKFYAANKEALQKHADLQRK